MPVLLAAGPAMGQIAMDAMCPVPDMSTPVANQPVEYVNEVCDILFRAIKLENVGDAVPQHTHDTDHATAICSGKARLWVNGKWVGDFEAFTVVAVKAGDDHIFQALAPNTVLSCVFRADKVDGGG